MSGDHPEPTFPRQSPSLPPVHLLDPSYDFTVQPIDVFVLDPNAPFAATPPVASGRHSRTPSTAPPRHPLRRPVLNIIVVFTRARDHRSAFALDARAAAAVPDQLR